MDFSRIEDALTDFEMHNGFKYTYEEKREIASWVADGIYHTGPITRVWTTKKNKDYVAVSFTTGTHVDSSIGRLEIHRAKIWTRQPIRPMLRPYLTDTHHYEGYWAYFGETVR